MAVTMNEKVEPKDPKSGDQKNEPSNVKKEEKEEKESLSTRFWRDPWTYLLRFQILLPHLLPSADLTTCLRYAGRITCTFTKRALNILIPMQLGRIVTVLESPTVTGSTVLTNVCVLILLKFLASGSGISAIEDYLWEPIEKEATARLNIASYRHLMSLSSDWHDNKKSAAVWDGVHAGYSVVHIISLISFDLIPKIFDLILSMGILWTQYDKNTAMVAVVTMLAYNWIAVRNQLHRRAQTRKMIESRGDQSNVLMETSTNWLTVAYFNRFDYEFKRYETAVRSHQQTSGADRLSAHLWSAIRHAIILLGLGSACLSVAGQVRRKERTAADFIVFITYWTQLIGPLTSFVGNIMYIGRILVQTEKLVEIFETKSSIQETEDAANLKVTEGKIEFKDVTFGYKAEREILKNVSFQCIPGSTTAIVGETGGGKSTMLKLMARFYDSTSGTITIDDQDIKQAKLDSLRDLFGHVPQSIGVFNTTILDNLRYGKLDATQSECEEACKTAALHDRILAFPDGYGTLVGEKGVKLSGGELQRLAIARVVLQNPKLLLLDEATSSVDTATEAMIQESLKKVTQGRTTVVVAHRLSTIAHADQILVVKEGQIIERGTHEFLLAKEGVYHGLWTRQEVKQTQRTTGAASPIAAGLKIMHRAKSCPSLKQV